MRSAEGCLAALVVVGAALHFLGGNIADPDLWGHLRYGAMIWDGHGLPREDVFSYTAPGAPFYDHEWLSDLVIAGIYRALGPAGLIAFKLSLCAAMIALFVDAARSLGRLAAPAAPLRPLTVALVLVPVLAVVHPGATFRPQLFTMLFLALEGALLARADLRFTAPPRPGEEAGRRVGWELAVVPILLLVWANLHGGFLVGLGIFGLYAAAAALRARWLGRETGRSEEGAALGRADAVRVAVLVVLAIAAPLANPYGTELYTYLGATLGMHGEISEWRPVGLLSGEFLRFKVLVAAAAVAVAFLWRCRDRLVHFAVALGWRVPVLAVAALYGFTHQRHTVLFAEVAAPLLIVAAEQARRRAVERWPEIAAPRVGALRACAVGIAAVALFQIAGYAATLRRDGLEIRFGRLDYPVDAVEFLRAHGIRGNVAFPFEWGAYAISEMAPDVRVFIDGRFEAVYPERVIDDYFAFMNGTPGWERLLDDYPTDVVVVQRWRDIHPRLFARDDLEYVYSDPASFVFVRRNERNAPVLARLAKTPDRTAFARRETFFP